MGIFIQSLFPFNFSSIIFLLISGGSIILYQLLSHTQYSKKLIGQYSLLFIMTVFIVSGGIGMMRYSLFTRVQGDPSLRAQVNEKVELKALIISEADERETGVRFVAKLHDKKKTNILFIVEAFSQLHYGDEIILTGLLEQPENFETDNGRIFDYVSFLAKENIFFIMRNPEVEVIESHQASKIKEILFRLKNRYIKNIEDTIPFPASRLASGITIAGKGALPKKIQEEFQRTGTLQAVVLSGYNTTIIAEAFMAICSFLPFFVASSIGALGIILFTIMAGGSATIVRGSIMALLVIFSKLIRRNYSVTRALLVAAFLMLTMNPMLLVFDPSFQLSFLATLGLITLSPIIDTRLQWIGSASVRQMVSSGLAAQLFVTPFLLYSSGELSVVALPTNFLLSLFIPITMLTCFITGALGFMSVFLSWPVSFLAFIFLWIDLTLVHIFSLIPFASVKISYFPWWVMVLVYMSFGVLIRKFYKKHEGLAYEKTHAYPR